MTNQTLNTCHSCRVKMCEVLAAPGNELELLCEDCYIEQLAKLLLKESHPTCVGKRLGVMPPEDALQIHCEIAEAYLRKITKNPDATLYVTLENGDIHYTEENQDLFNDILDKVEGLLEQKNILKRNQGQT